MIDLAKIKATAGAAVIPIWNALMDIMPRLVVRAGKGTVITQTSKGTAISAKAAFYGFHSRWRVRIIGGKVLVGAGLINGMPPENAGDGATEVDAGNAPEEGKKYVLAEVKTNGEGKMESFSIRLGDDPNSQEGASSVTATHALAVIVNGRVYHISYFDLQHFVSITPQGYRHYFCPA